MKCCQAVVGGECVLPCDTAQVGLTGQRVQRSSRGSPLSMRSRRASAQHALSGARVSRACAARSHKVSGAEYMEGTVPCSTACMSLSMRWVRQCAHCSCTSIKTAFSQGCMMYTYWQDLWCRGLWREWWRWQGLGRGRLCRMWGEMCGGMVRCEVGRWGGPRWWGVGSGVDCGNWLDVCNVT
jgi:hypothetical protein